MARKARPHQLLISREIAEIFGFSEPDMLMTLKQGGPGESVRLDVDDQTWQRYVDPNTGSVMQRRMRDVLVIEAARRAAANGFKRSPGTIFMAERQTDCPHCGKPVGPNAFAVRATTQDRSRTADYHITCANEEAIPLQTTDATLNGGLKRMLNRLWLVTHDTAKEQWGKFVNFYE